MALRVLVIFFLLVLPASALFLAGQSEQGGAISVLCEGQSTAFLSLPGGEVRALALDDSSQAAFFPQSPGPYTVQCGNETRTISVQLQGGGEVAYSGGDLPLAALGAALLAAAAAYFSACHLFGRGIAFSKTESGGHARLSISAGCDLRDIVITDPEGGDGMPLSLSIAHLPAGADWSWEYEKAPGAPLLAARLSAKANGKEISMLSSTAGKSAGVAKMKEGRALEKIQPHPRKEGGKNQGMHRLAKFSGPD